MNSAKFSWVYVLCMALVMSPIMAKALELGNAIPAAKTPMLDVSGSKISIADIQGEKGTLVIFACNSCPWVKAWLDRIVEIGNTYSHKGIGVIMINSNDPQMNDEDSFEVMKRRASEKGMKFPYVVDETSEVARAFGATRTPEAFLFDASGKLVYHGAIDDNAREPEAVSKTYLKDALNALLKNQDIQLKEAKAIGCTIKFRTLTKSQS